MALILLTTPTPEVTPAVVHQPVLVQAETTLTEDLTVRYIELYRKFEYFEVKTLIKEMDELRKRLVAVANETVDEKKPAIFICAQGEVEFSERGKATEVPNPLALIQDLLLKFGPEVTASVVSIAITPLRKILSEHELKKYLQDQPGARTLRSVRPVA